ncbi:MAG: uracil-DNA glycosylase [Cyclobacteriaceae bacterium]
MDVKIESGWKNELKSEFSKDYFIQLTDFVRSEYRQHTVYPPGKEMFNAFDFSPFDDTRVVILGQDPYHGHGQANGLCFSVREGVRMPPSLVNIFKEVKDDIGKDVPAHGSLERWAKQGVLLLNATLTVRQSSPGSHQGRGWEEFTDAVVKLLSEKKENLVFMLWGAYAQRKGEIIDQSRHLVLKSAHPSPFAAHKGFFGNRHFSQANEYLKKNGLQPIDW